MSCVSVNWHTLEPKKSLVLSEMMVFGGPNLVTSSSRNSTISASVAFFRSMASVHLVKYYVAVRIQLCPVLEAALIIAMKLRPHCTKGSSSTIRLRGIVEFFLVPTKNWNSLQAFTKEYESLNSVGQMYLVHMILMDVVFAEKCPPMGLLWKVSRFSLISMW